MSDNPYLPEGINQSDSDRQPDTRPGCLSANFIGLVFLLLTALFLTYFVTLMVNPYLPVNPLPPRTPLPLYVVASADPNQVAPTATATKPPSTPRLSTLAPTGSPTLPPTVRSAVSDTPVLVTLESLPTNTRIPPTATLFSGSGGGEVVEGVFTPPPPVYPGEVTRAPYPFTIYENTVDYTANPNDQGCRWASIAGTVIDLDGVPVAGLAVHVIGEGIDDIRFSGTAPTYGLGGYEVFLNGAPLTGQYIVQLLSQTGAPVSAEFVANTLPQCENNVVIINFVQNHDY